MKRITRALALIALAAGVLAVTGSAGATTRGVAPAGLRTVTAWPFTTPYGSFAESMALGPDGYLYVSHTTWGDDTNTGTIERVSPLGGTRSTVVDDFDVDSGLLAGVGFDARGRLYAAVATFSADRPPCVARLGSNGALGCVLTLPVGSFPNGLAFHDNYLYVTDAGLGAVWRFNTEGPAQTQTQPWLKAPYLAPLSAEGLGPDGIAFRGSTLYITHYDRGAILQVVVLPNGSPGPLRTLTVNPALVSADGIAVDLFGNIWVTVNGPGTGRLAVVLPSGRVFVLANQPSWLDYPTQPVFTSPWSLFISNGSYDNGAPSIIALGPMFLF